MIVAGAGEAWTRKDLAERMQQKTHLVRQLFRGGLNNDDVRQLFRLIDWLMQLPPALEGAFWLEVTTLQKEKHVPFVTSFERIEREHMRVEARAEGLAEGRAAGQAEGRLQGLRDGISLGLELRFGEAGTAAAQELADVSELAVLERIMDALRAGSPLEEIRKIRQP